MPAATMTTGKALQLLDPVQQSPEAGDADIDDLLGGEPFEGQGAGRLARHRHVRGSGGHDRHPRLARRRMVAAPNGGARQGLIIELIPLVRRQFREPRFVEAGQQQVETARRGRDR